MISQLNVGVEVGFVGDDQSLGRETSHQQERESAEISSRCSVEKEEDYSWRLGLSEMINHSGEKPVINKKGKVQKSVLGAVSKKKKTIRGGDDDDSDDDDDY